ncbi:hypothetical protein MNV49_006942 [Pseudohyphozyma bogoriensis]|nr:hypothetical protein MNV49_006942 [Pseudohyphozyma bogoriensis]
MPRPTHILLPINSTSRGPYSPLTPYADSDSLLPLVSPSGSIGRARSPSPTPTSPSYKESFDGDREVKELRRECVTRESWRKRTTVRTVLLVVLALASGTGLVLWSRQVGTPHDSLGWLSMLELENLGISDTVKGGFSGAAGGMSEAWSVDVDVPPEGPIPISVFPSNFIPCPAFDENVATSSIDALQSNETASCPTSTLPLPAPGEKFLGFLPHSGFHNQRLALQNALVLGRLLNRTVLIPPIWIGWPTATQYYHDLQAAWTKSLLRSPSSFGFFPATLDSSLSLPANYTQLSFTSPLPNYTSIEAHRLEVIAAVVAKGEAKWHEMGYETKEGYPVTGLSDKECKSYSPLCRWSWRDTFLSWESLVGSGIGGRERWDIREMSVEAITGVGREDVYVLDDQTTYDLQFVLDSTPSLITPAPPASRFARRVSIPVLANLPQKVVLVGSLFGSNRVPSRGPYQSYHKAASRSMAFRNPWILRAANGVVERMGGEGSYVGVHARVGDGTFERNAVGNMKSLLGRVLKGLGVEEEEVRGLWEEEEPKADEGEERAEEKEKRELLEESYYWSMLDGETDKDEDGIVLQKRSPSPATPPPSLNPQHNLICRSPLHASSSLQILNTPLYLATDARSPLSHPALQPFFRTFPCVFVLDDCLDERDGVKEVGEIKRLVNKADGVDLGRLFLPFLEAVIAAKGGLSKGTSGSTFSAFAEGDLHDAYLEERGGKVEVEETAA